MNSAAIKTVIRFKDYQCEFSFDWQDQSLFVLHAEHGNRLIE